MKKIITALVILVIVALGTYYLVFSDNVYQTPTDTLSTPSAPSY